jgi:hypothetical protein
MYKIYKKNKENKIRSFKMMTYQHILPFPIRIPGNQHGHAAVKGSLAAVFARPQSSGLWHLVHIVYKGQCYSSP